MHLSLNIITIALLHFFFSIILPGIATYSLIIKYFRQKTVWNTTSILKCISLGLIYNFIQFIIILIILAYIPKTNQIFLVIIKYLSDFVFTLISYIRNQNVFKINLYKLILLKDFLLSDKLLIIFSSFIGFLAVFNYPHVYPSHILWTNTLIHLPASDLSPYILGLNNSGNLGYSALNYFTGVIFTNLPLATLASGFKLILIVLFSIVIINIVNCSKLINKQLIKITYFLLLFSGKIGITDMFWAGHDTMWGVLFCFIYFFSFKDILSNPKTNLNYFFSAIYFLCALIISPATVPYLATFTLFFIITGSAKINTSKLINYLLILNALPLIITFKSVFYNNMLLLTVISIILFILYFIPKNSLIQKLKTISTNSYTNIILSILNLFFFLAAMYLLPISLPERANILFWPYENIINDTTITCPREIINVYVTPLDGQTTLINNLLFNQNNDNRFSYIVFIGLLGIFLLGTTKNNCPIIKAISMTPFFIFFTILILIKINFYKYFTLTNDFISIANDIIKRYGTILFSFFMFLFVNTCTTKFIKSKLAQNIFIALFCLVILIVCFQPVYDNLLSLKNGAYYSSIGGSKDPLFSRVTESLYYNQDKGKIFFSLFAESIRETNTIRYAFYLNKVFYYTDKNLYKNISDSQLDAITVINPNVNNDFLLLYNNLPIVLLSDPSSLQTILSYPGNKIKVKLINSYKGTTDALYLITKN